MHAFEYHRPTSTKDAIALGEKQTEGRYLAGGQSLVQAMKLRLSSPTDLVDLNALGDLKSLKVEGNAVIIGSMVRHAEVAASSSVAKAIPALAALAGIIGDRQVRHMGTIGGSLANNDPAAG
jgi:carbon-monoxide dehydrogenase medium subunit